MILGIALGGGGIAGCAHIGVLQALEDEGLQIDVIAGSSCGAIIAALYSFGYSPQEMIGMLPTITKQYIDYDYKTFMSKIFKRSTKITGLIKGTKIRGLIADKTGNAAITDLKLPTAITATDLRNAKQVYFISRPFKNPCDGVDVIEDIPVADAVHASVSIPVLFKPVCYGDRVFIDGGLMDNCPVSAVRALGANKIIAADLVCAGPIDTSFDSVISVIKRCISINLAIKSEITTREADVILRPEVSSVGLMDFSKIIYCVEKGYEYTRRRIHEIYAELERISDHFNFL